jgi:alcohol dehydrogenase class IV
MQFEFATATRIIFGTGKVNAIGEIIEGMGDKILIINGAPSNISDKLHGLLDCTGTAIETIRVKGEPTVETIQNAINFARQILANLVIGIGGGSALDTAKATAALLANHGEITDYLEVIGLHKPLTHPSIPLITIPTTAGTGAEVTKNAVIGVPTYHVKVSLRSPYLLPKVAVVDPELTLSVPPEVTAATGLDALTQLIEPFTCNSPNPLTDALCIEGIKRIAQSLTRVYENGEDLEARVDMSIASLFSGLALANAKLGAVHGLAGVIGGEISAPHGAICACLLPLVMQTNVKALATRLPQHQSLRRYTEIGRLLTGRPDATHYDAIQWVKDICKKFNIHSLSKFGLLENQFTSLIEMAMRSSSMQGNPITLFDEELRSILRGSI